MQALENFCLPGGWGRPLAAFGTVIFTVFALATGLADPKNSKHFSLAPLGVIAVLALLSFLYVRFYVPRLRAQAAARTAAAARPKRRPPRPTASEPSSATDGSSASKVSGDPTVSPMEP